MSYKKFKDQKLCSFIVPCESYLQQEKIYNLLNKRKEELEVNSYVDNCFTYTFIDNIKKKIDTDYAKVSIRMDMFCNNKFDKDDILHMKRVIERICSTERSEPRIFGGLFPKKPEILMESNNEKVLNFFTVNVQEEEDKKIQNSLTKF